MSPIAETTTRGTPVGSALDDGAGPFDRTGTADRSPSEFQDNHCLFCVSGPEAQNPVRLVADSDAPGSLSGTDRAEVPLGPWCGRAGAVLGQALEHTL